MALFDASALGSSLYRQQVPARDESGLMTSCACHLQTDSATGPALQAAFMVMGSIGGKLLLFQAASPSVGVGRIKARDLPTLYGTDRYGITT